MNNPYISRVDVSAALDSLIYSTRKQEAGGLRHLLLVDLLTLSEEVEDRYSGHLRFDIGLLADRVVGATDWLAQDLRTAGLSIGLFGASTGGGATLVAAAHCPERIGAVVSRATRHRG